MQPKPQTTPVDTLRSLINEARLACEHPNSSPALSHLMMTKPFLKRIMRMRGVWMHLLAYGLNSEIRRFLKGDEADGDGSTVDQLDLWPAHLRAVVADIDRARVFVPSRGEYVSLEPTAITIDETQEAGDFLIVKGQNCVRIGTQLVELSKIWRSGATTNDH
jgi:hypothetical protein